MIHWRGNFAWFIEKGIFFFWINPWYFKDKYEAKFKSRKLMLLKKMVSFKKEKNESMKEFFKNIRDSLDQLKGIDFSRP